MAHCARGIDGCGHHQCTRCGARFVRTAEWGTCHVKSHDRIGIDGLHQPAFGWFFKSALGLASRADVGGVVCGRDAGFGGLAIRRNLDATQSSRIALSHHDAHLVASAVKPHLSRFCAAVTGGLWRIVCVLGHLVVCFHSSAAFEWFAIGLDSFVHVHHVHHGHHRLPFSFAKNRHAQNHCTRWRVQRLQRCHAVLDGVWRLGQCNQFGAGHVPHDHCPRYSSTDWAKRCGGPISAICRGCLCHERVFDDAVSVCDRCLVEPQH